MKCLHVLRLCEVSECVQIVYEVSECVETLHEVPECV